MEKEGKILLQLSRIIYLLYPAASKGRRINNYTNYKRRLKKYGIKAYPIPNTRFVLYDITSLDWEVNGNLSVEDLAKNRSNYITLREWTLKHKPPLDRHLVHYLLRTKTIPYLRVRGAKKLIFIPASLDLVRLAFERVKKEWEEFQQRLAKLAQGSIHAIIIPKWKKYPRKLQRFFRFLLAQQGRLLRVGKTYGVLVSTLDFTLYDLLEREKDIASLAYYIPANPDRTIFRRALGRGEVAVVEPHEINFPVRDLALLLVSSKPQIQTR